MSIEILQDYDTASAKYVRARIEKTEATVGIFSDGRVNVSVHNAANRVFRGLGRTFKDQAASLDAFKSPKVKAIIQTAFFRCA